MKLACLVLGMAVEMPPIAYREPRGGSIPPDTPDGGGMAPPAMRIYQA